jgi:mRNA interferase HigB
MRCEARCSLPIPTFAICEIWLVTSHFAKYNPPDRRYQSIRSSVWIISKSRLRQFWESPGNSAAKGPCAAWYAHVEHCDWRNWADVRGDYASADAVGGCVVFNIGGNKYRLVTRILYVSHKVFILKVMTHADYDKQKWIDECGCYSPPPQTKRRAKTAQSTKPSSTGRKKTYRANPYAKRTR